MVLDETMLRTSCFALRLVTTHTYLAPTGLEIFWREVGFVRPIFFFGRTTTTTTTTTTTIKARRPQITAEAHLLE